MILRTRLTLLCLPPFDFPYEPLNRASGFLRPKHRHIHLAVACTEHIRHVLQVVHCRFQILTQITALLFGDWIVFHTKALNGLRALLTAQYGLHSREQHLRRKWLMKHFHCAGLHRLLAQYAIVVGGNENDRDVGIGIVQADL